MSMQQEKAKPKFPYPLISGDVFNYLLIILFGQSEFYILCVIMVWSNYQGT